LYKNNYLVGYSHRLQPSERTIQLRPLRGI